MEDEKGVMNETDRERARVDSLPPSLPPSFFSMQHNGLHLAA
jgi:hypothetical protein